MTLLSLTVYAAYWRTAYFEAFCVFAQSLVTSVAYCVLRIALWKLAVTSVVHCVLRIVVWSTLCDFCCVLCMA